MKYRYREPVEAFQWHELGDGPEGWVVPITGHEPEQTCTRCGHRYKWHGVLAAINFTARVCPGSWVTKTNEGRWARYAHEEFERMFEPVEEAGE